MAEYNSQSIDIDLEDMFNGLSQEDQMEYLADMFGNLPGEEERADVVKDNISYLEDDTVIDIIADAFVDLSSSDRQETAERIVDTLTPAQREALVKYIEEV